MQTLESFAVLSRFRYSFLILVVLSILGPKTLLAGLTLSPCGTDNTLEVVEDKGDNLFTCSGLTADQTVTWTLIQPQREVDLGFCGVSPGYLCTELASPVFLLERSGSSTGTLIVNATDQRFDSLFQGTTLQCVALRNNAEEGSARCTVDHIAKPTSSACDVTHNTGTVSSGWTLTVNCIVSGVYSYLNRYTCQLSQTSPSGSSPTSAVNMTVTPDSGNYKTGQCDVTVPFPDSSATYSYKMIVTPGRVDVPASFGGSDSFQITKPSSQPSHTCPQYVTETGGLTCTCSADLGQPAGVVRWSGYPGNQLSLSNVDRTQNGTLFLCEVMWNGKRVQSVVYTLQVAYGPSHVSISTPSLPYDSNGSQTMTLTCSARDVNPSVTFTWPRLPSNNVVVQGQTVTFTPQPPGDDNSVFECRAENSFTKTVKTSNTTISLNYPPSTDPVITMTSVPPNSQGHLYRGDRVTLTCLVTGGKPVSATALTFTCPGKADSPDTKGSTGVISTVTFDNLNDSDHNTVCTCSTRWNNTDWYNRSNSTRIFVNSPPSSPRVQAPSTGYPFLATVTQSATLTCDSSTPGRPSATYTWPVNHGGSQGMDNSGQGTLTFDTLSKEHDGKTVSCRASNRYTDNRQPVPDGNFTMEVYYHPEVHLVPVNDTNPNQCQPLTSDPSHCLVPEGQRVHFRCTASSSKPPAQVFTWRPGSGNSTDLYIPSANRSLHTGTYNCSVETGLGNHGNDPRLPLRNSAMFTVLVTYATAISSFTVNSVTSHNFTVNTSDTVTLTCRADGRPSPEMRLLNSKSDVMAEVAQGTPSVDDRTTEVTGSVTARCHDTGIYTCHADNGFGQRQTRQVSVFVRCKPEVLDQGAGGEDSTTIPSVDYATKAVRFAFHVAAYPTPQLRNVTFFTQKPNATSVGKQVTRNKIDVTCSRHSDRLFNVTCVVTVDNVTREDDGFYRAFVGNSLGDIERLFQVTVNASISSPTTQFPVAAAAGGIAAAVLVIGGVALFLVWWKRRKGERKGERPRRTYSEDARDTPEMIDNVIYDSSGNKDEVMIVNDIYGTSAHGNNAPQTAGSRVQQSNPYEDVDITKAKPEVLPKPTPTSGTSPGEVSDVYASVVKVPKQTDPSSPADSTRPSVKPKPGKKSKEAAKTHEKGKHKPNVKDDKQPLHQTDASGTLYGNITPLSMSPMRNQGTVYENCAFSEDEADRTKTEQEKADDDSRMMHPDGLEYTTIAFTAEQRKRAEQPPPEREVTDYADIDFTRRVPK